MLLLLLLELAEQLPQVIGIRPPIVHVAVEAVEHAVDLLLGDVMLPRLEHYNEDELLLHALCIVRSLEQADKLVALHLEGLHPGVTMRYAENDAL